MIQQKKHKIQDELFKTQHSKDHAKKFMTDHNKLFNNYQLERDDALLNLRTWNEKILTMMKSYVKGKAFIREHSIKRRRTSNRIHNSNNNKNNSKNNNNISYTYKVYLVPFSDVQSVIIIQKDIDLSISQT